MARSPSELQAILKELEGVEDAYFQPPSSQLMEFPCIQFTRSAPDRYMYADNKKYVLLRGYSVMVIDRMPDSLIPDQVESLPHTSFDRSYRVEGLNHFVYHMYF